MMFKTFPPIIWCFCFLFPPSALKAQPSALPLQLTGYHKNGRDVFSLQGNIASLARIKGLSAGAFTERSFMMEGLSCFAGGVSVGSKSGQFGFLAERRGSKYIAENHLSLSYARVLGPVIDLGTRFHYGLITTKGYGNLSTISASIAARFHVNESFLLGFQLAHPAAFSSDPHEGRPFKTFSFGGGWQVSDQLHAVIEMFKEEGQPPEIRAMVDYRPQENFLLRVGWSSGEGILVGAVGLCLKTIRLDFTSSFHPQLGLSPGLGLIYSRNPDK